jgi:hypothetical protein
VQTITKYKPVEHAGGNMKRLADRMPQKFRGKLNIDKKHVKIEQDIDTFPGISCDCCDESAARIPQISAPIDSTQIGKTKLSDNKQFNSGYEVEDENHEYEDCCIPKQKNLFGNTPLLIVIGLAATVPIVFLELFLPDSLASSKRQ